MLNYRILCLSILIFLSGCQEDNDNKDANPAMIPDSISSQSTLYTEDIYITLQEGGLTHIPINERAKSSSNEPVTLDSVKLIEGLDSNCQNMSHTDDEITFWGNTSGICIYEYTVSSKNTVTPYSSKESFSHATETAFAFVSIQPKNVNLPTNSTLLTPISITLQRGHADHSINVKTQLGTNFPENVGIDNTVTVLGSGTAVVNQLSDTITYSGGQQGVSRLIYSLTNTNDGTKYLGAIDITISDTDNDPPTIQNFEFKKPHPTGFNVKEGEEVIIDVSPYVSDANSSQVLQIVELNTINATAVPFSTTLQNNLKFKFKASVLGTYYVAVTISDHNGGYATGLVKIIVHGGFSYILVGTDAFSPPITVKQADYIGISYDDVYSEGSSTGPQDLLMALVDFNIAEAICRSKGGALPTKEQMDAFRLQESLKLWIAADSTKQQWPIGRAYFTSVTNNNNVTMVTFFSNGTSNSLEFQAPKSSALGYVTCIDLSPVSLSIDNNYAIVGESVTLTASFKNRAGETYPYTKPLEWRVSKGNNHLVIHNGNQAGGLSEGEVTLDTNNLGHTLSATKTLDVKTRATLSGISNQTVNENTAFELTPTATGGNGAITWSLEGLDANKVSINSTSGKVTMIARNFESPVDSNANNIYKITIIATDADNITASKSMTITVINVDETPTLSGITNKSINENSSFELMPTATGGFGTITWSVSGDDASKVSINSTSGKVTMVARNFESPVDKSANNVYEITITATDADGNNTSKSMTITVTNVDETPTLSGITNKSINENRAFELTPTATGGFGTITWSVSGDDASKVSINSTSGKVIMVARDFESPVDKNSNNVYEITITATDADGNSASKSMTITILNVNEAPAISGITNKTINENSAFTLTPTVTGGSGTITWSVSGSDASKVSINRTSGKITMVARNFESPADRNTNNVYEITITATDTNSASDSKNMTITVLDVQETANLVIGNVSNQFVNTGVAFTSTTPSIANAIGNVTWSVTGVDVNKVSVNRNSGVVSMVARSSSNPVDSDKNNIYSINLVATDADGNTKSKAFTIKVISPPVANESSQRGYWKVAPNGYLRIPDFNYTAVDHINWEFEDPTSNQIAILSKQGSGIIVSGKTCSDIQTVRPGAGSLSVKAIGTDNVGNQLSYELTIVITSDNNKDCKGVRIGDIYGWEN